MSSPEELAREKIDKLLTDCGWIIQNRSTINLSAGRGIAIREGLLKGGEADYLLFGDGKALGTVEAKPEGYTLIGVEEQSGKMLYTQIAERIWDPEQLNKLAT
jgi:type I restriction enzyme, R subunit